MTQLGAAEGTLSKDDRAWTFWEEFSVAYGWDPVVSRQLAVDFPDLLSSRLGLFLLWVYPKIKGKRLPDANPRSVLNSYPGAICRVLKRDYKLPVPKAATYEAEAGANVREVRVSLLIILPTPRGQSGLGKGAGGGNAERCCSLAATVDEPLRSIGVSGAPACALARSLSATVLGPSFSTRELKAPPKCISRCSRKDRPLGGIIGSGGRRDVAIRCPRDRAKARTSW